jgi:hypothetical protein
MKFITELNIQADVERLRADLNLLLEKHNGWPKEDFDLKMPGNQLSATHRPGEDIWTDGTGNLWDPVKEQFVATEADFSEYNPYLGEYTKSVLEELKQKEGVNLGRIRYMLLEPKKGLSIHKDFDFRYHLVLNTNAGALFGETMQGDVKAACYHLPSNGIVYKVDTTREHFVYNGGWENRIHLVINKA